MDLATNTVSPKGCHRHIIEEWKCAYIESDSDSDDDYGR